MEVEHLPEDDVESGQIVSMTSAVTKLRFLVKPTSCILSSDRIDTGLSEDTLQPRQHQLGPDHLRVVEDETSEANHVLEGVVLVLSLVKEPKHLGMREGGGGHRHVGTRRRLRLRPGQHAVGLRLSEPRAEI